MNIINTVGDLKRALSVYDDALPLVISDTDRKTYILNNSTQMAHVRTPIGEGCGEHFELFLVPA